MLEEPWTKISAEADGVFEFLRWKNIPQGMRSYALVAETILASDEPGICQLNLGFSDSISVLLNNQIISHADASFRYSQNRQEGVLHDQQKTLFLPLKQGSNKLQMIVADSFGGWGLKVAMHNCPTVKFNTEY